YVLTQRRAHQFRTRENPPRLRNKRCQDAKLRRRQWHWIASPIRASLRQIQTQVHEFNHLFGRFHGAVDPTSCFHNKCQRMLSRFCGFTSAFGAATGMAEFTKLWPAAIASSPGLSAGSALDAITLRAAVGGAFVAML